MVTRVTVDLEDDAHERLKAWKDARGMTWGDVLFHGVDAEGDGDV